MDLLIFLKKKRLALDSEVSNFHVHLNIDMILHKWTKKELKLEQTGLKDQYLGRYVGGHSLISEEDTCMEVDKITCEELILCILNKLMDRAKLYR